MTKLEKFYYWLIKRLPKRMKYLIAIDVTAFATTGKYSDTIVPELTALEAINRYANDHNID